MSSTTSLPPPSSLLRLLRQPRATSTSSHSPFYTTTVVDTSSAGPLHSATWLCALPCTFGIGNTGTCLRPRRATGSGKPGTRLDLGGLTASSSLRPQRITIFIFLRRLRTTTIWLLLAGQRLHVRLPRQLRQPRLPYARHPRPWLFTLISATSTLTQRAIIYLSYLSIFSPVAASAPHRRYNCGGMSLCRLLPSTSSPVSSSAVLPL